MSSPRRPSDTQPEPRPGKEKGAVYLDGQRGGERGAISRSDVVGRTPRRGNRGVQPVIATLETLTGFLKSDAT